MLVYMPVCESDSASRLIKLCGLECTQVFKNLVVLIFYIELSQ